MGGQRSHGPLKFLDSIKIDFCNRNMFLSVAWQSGFCCPYYFIRHMQLIELKDCMYINLAFPDCNDA